MFYTAIQSDITVIQFDDDCLVFGSGKDETRQQKLLS